MNYNYLMFLDKLYVFHTVGATSNEQLGSSHLGRCGGFSSLWDTRSSPLRKRTSWMSHLSPQTMKFSACWDYLGFEGSMYHIWEHCSMLGDTWKTIFIGFREREDSPAGIRYGCN